MGRRLWSAGSDTYWAEGDGGSGQAYQAAVAGMWVVDGICILVAELVEDGEDAVVVLGGHQLADDALKPGQQSKVIEFLGIRHQAGDGSLSSWARTLERRLFACHRSCR